MRDLNAPINEAPKEYLSLANTGQYVEVRHPTRRDTTVVIKVNDVVGDWFIGTVKLIHGHAADLHLNEKVRVPTSSAIRCYDETMRPL